MEMRRVVWAEYVSADGVVDEPSWTGPFWNDELSQMQKAQLFRSDALLLGRVTYEGFAKAWPKMTDESGFANRMNSLPKHVASRALKQAEWYATVIEGDVAGAVSSA
jgi:dihydrofolate reductase